MDLQTLSTLLATTYSSDPNVRKSGEIQLRRVAGVEGLISGLMQIIASDGLDQGTRQAATVFLKNRVIKAYHLEPTTPTEKTPAYPPPIPSTDKEALKSSLLPLLVAVPDRSTRLQLALALRTIVSNDFPNNWPGLLEEIGSYLNSGDVRKVGAGVVALLELVKSFRYRQTTPVLPTVIETTFPTLVQLGLSLLNSPPSEDSATLLHLILKTYKTTLVLHLSKHQQTSESIVPWGRLLFAVVNLQIPKEVVPEDEDERERSEWWKAKKWAYGTLDRLFHRFGNPSQLPSTMRKEYANFANHFVNSFAPEIIKTYLQQIELFVSNQTWLSRKCQYLIFQFFTECVKPKSTWALLRPHFESLVSNFVFPQLCFTRKKEELWESDEVEYIRTSIDEYEDYSSPVSSATSFLVSLASNRTKTCFLPILGFVNRVLDSNPPPSQKFGALNVTAALAPFIVRHEECKSQMEAFLMRHVLPIINAPEGYLRAVACESVYVFVRFELEFVHESNLKALFDAVLRAMDDPALPVRVHAAQALTEMVQQYEIVRTAVSGMVGKVIQELLKLSDETDLDVLNHMMEVMVEQYHNELLPVASQLTARLCHTYTRLLQEAHTAGINAGSGLELEPDERAPDDDKTFAAMGVAKTIGTIVSSVDASPDILNEIQQIIIPIIAYTLEVKALDLFDNAYDLVDSLTFNLRSISPQMWPIFDSTYALFKSDAIDFLDEMLPALDNFLSYGKDMFISRPDYTEKILDIYVTSMTSDQLGEGDRYNGSKLIESLMLNLRGHVDSALQQIIATAIKAMDPPPETKSLKLGNLEVLINTVLYNPAAALHIIQTQHAGKLEMFFTQWFELLKEDLLLPRVHDKKLSILAMCALLTLDPIHIPPVVEQGWGGIVRGILVTFSTLPRAVNDRKALIDKANEDDDDDDATEPDPFNHEEEDDDTKDVWDEDSQYVEFLAQESERLRARQEAKAGDGTQEEDGSDEDDDDDVVEEDLGFISPLENVDPYLTFKNALTVFQEKNPNAYQTATTSLDIEQQTALMEVMRLAEQGTSF